MILHGIEYQRPTSLNMRILADHVTYSFLAFMKSIFHFCLGCYCGGYSQNGRSNLSSFQYIVEIVYKVISLDVRFVEYMDVLYTWIDQSQKSHNASEKYPTIHHFSTKICTFLLQNNALWDIRLVHCGICEISQWLWSLNVVNRYTLEWTLNRFYWTILLETRCHTIDVCGPLRSNLWFHISI